MLGASAYASCGEDTCDCAMGIAAWPLPCHAAHAKLQLKNLVSFSWHEQTPKLPNVIAYTCELTETSIVQHQKRMPYQRDPASHLPAAQLPH